MLAVKTCSWQVNQRVPPCQPRAVQVISNQHDRDNSPSLAWPQAGAFCLGFTVACRDFVLAESSPNFLEVEPQTAGRKPDHRNNLPGNEVINRARRQAETRRKLAFCEERFLHRSAKFRTFCCEYSLLGHTSEKPSITGSKPTT